MARKRRSRGRKTTNLLDMAANINVAAQFIAPYITGGVAERALAGDFKGALDAVRPATKEALAAKNLLEAFGPKLGLAVLRMGLGLLGTRRSARIGKFVIG